LPLSKEEYKVLLAFANGLSDLGKSQRLQELRRIQRRNVRRGLEDSGLILSGGFCSLRKLKFQIGA
jgi:hypothetical protein